MKVIPLHPRARRCLGLDDITARQRMTVVYRAVPDRTMTWRGWVLVVTHVAALALGLIVGCLQ